MAMSHDERIVKVETCRAYHAGQRYYVEIDVVMDEQTPLRVSHDVAQSLQRKVEGLGDVERAFVHVDYEDDHDPHEEHKPLFDKKDKKQKRTLKERLLRIKKETEPTTQAEPVVTNVEGSKEQ
jgi:glycerophosphoryl diester phosphodiesterase